MARKRCAGFSAFASGKGVPGTTAGFFLAHSKYGKAPWARLVDPAARLASDEAARLEPKVGKHLYNRGVARVAKHDDKAATSLSRRNTISKSRNGMFSYSSISPLPPKTSV